jgi:hypothetical protein
MGVIELRWAFREAQIYRNMLLAEWATKYNYWICGLHPRQ